jgi:hypothetical protein
VWEICPAANAVARDGRWRTVCVLVCSPGHLLLLLVVLPELLLLLGVRAGHSRAAAVCRINRPIATMQARGVRACV